MEGVVVLFGLLVAIHGGAAAEVLDLTPVSIKVLENEGFLVSVPEMENLKWTNCSVKFAKNLLVSGLSFEKSSTDFGELTAFEKDNCGIRVSNVTMKANGKWLFTVYFDGGYRSRSVQVDVIEKKSHTCPSSSTPYCELWSAVLNEKMSCKDEVPENWGEHTCRSLRTGAMPMVEVPMEQKTVKPYQSQNIFMKDGRYIFECRMPKENKTLRSCLIRNENTGSLFNIHDGLNEGHYSAYMTSISDNVCQFEIPEDLRPDEVGTWRMDMYSNTNDIMHTCTFRLGLEKAIKEIKEKAEKPLAIDTLEDKETVECITNAMWPITRCYLQGGIYQNFRFSSDETEMSKGNCKFSVVINMVKNLELKCGFNGPKENDPDFLQPITMRRFTNKVIDGKVDHSENTIECHHIERTEINSCVFVSTSSEIFSVPSDKFKSDEFEYFGAGFKKGACGVKFKNGMTSGQWTCYIEKVGEKELLSTTEGLHV